MNFDIMLNNIVSKVGNWTDAALRAKILTEMQLVQEEMELAPVLPWFLWDEKDVTINASATTGTLPTGFIRLDKEFSYVRYVAADGKTAFLSPLNTEQYREYAEGLPAADDILAYSLTATQIIVAPAPLTGKTLKMFCAVKDPTVPVDSATTNLWATHAPNVLLYHTASRVASDLLQDYAQAERLETRFRSAWEVLKRDSYARMSEYLDAVKGDD